MGLHLIWRRACGFLINIHLIFTGKDKVKNYETLNVIYKWSENHFAPFQSFRLTGARKFTSFEVS